jgi:pyruvate dehydrogenase E2 component (dihydrolipoamide acetyltransferase)
VPITPKVILAAGGNGPAILLLHGYGADRLTWLANQQELAAVGRVYALDLPGHGETPLGRSGRVADLAGAVERAIDAAGTGPVHVVAHSLGGSVAMALAAARPDLVPSLALIAAGGLGGEVDADFLTQYPRAESSEEIDALLKRLVSRPRLINRFLVARVQAQLQTPGAREALIAIGEDLGRIHSVIAPAFKTIVNSALPRLTIWGETDTIVPLDRARLASFGGDSFVIADAAHLPQIESARIVNERLVAWLSALA